MAALLEKMRDHRLHPVMTQRERDLTYGVQTPKCLRKSLPPEQRNGNKSAGNRRQEPEDMAAAVQTDPLEESQAPQQTNSGKIAPIKRQSVTSGQLPHAQQQQASPLWHVALKPSLIVLGGGTAVYTLIFFVALICIGVGNLVTYGPIPTSYTTATIHGQPARIITSNDHGDITVTVKIQQKDGTLLVRSYAGPALNPDTWNGNLNTVVATSQVGSDGQTIIVHLIGEVNYFHPFLVRPAQDFSLIPDKQAGYKISA